MNLLFEFYYLWLFVVFVVLGFFFGRVAEARHYKSLDRREAEFADILVFSEPRILKEFSRHSGLVMGSVVLSNDYFKLILATFRAIFGGNIKVYESLLIRARREAVLRMKAEARDAGARGVFNVKIETSTIGNGAQRTTTSVEVLAYGTAVF